MTEPLVIVGIGGGLVQWDVVKPGSGLPRVFYLDYDIEGLEGDELSDFADRIQEAHDALDEFGEDEAETLLNMEEAIKEYRQMVADGESAPRFR